MSENNIFNEFSEYSQKILRKNNIDGVLKPLVKQQAKEIELEFVKGGYKIQDVVRDFLELCAYFEIRFPYDKEKPYHEVLIADPTGCIDLIDRLDLYEVYGKQFCPIAYLRDGSEVMLDEDEKLYVFVDGDLDLFGDSLTTGIDEIFKGKNGSRNRIDRLS